MKNMKILIAYDGSSGADAALDDLLRAGLPREAEAVVISVAEVWLPAPSSYGMVEMDFTTESNGREKEAFALAKQACERMNIQLPDWKVRAEAGIGSPASVVLQKADQWKPDLIIVGSHSRSDLGRFLLGSVSQKVVTEAHCSVRVARAGVQESDFPERIIIGVDSSLDAEAAVEVVAARAWPKNTEVRLVTAIGPPFPGVEIEKELSRAEKLQQAAKTKLHVAGLNVSSVVEAYKPQRLILDEAERWRADCIFVGMKGADRLTRFLLGSVATAVVARAHCSVEVVRTAEAA